MNKKDIYQQIENTINSSKNILLCLHPGPDEDSIGSCLAMYWYLKGLGKNPTLISGDSELPSRFFSLPGFDQIIRKNYFQININQFDLQIILDAGGLNQISNLKPITFPPHLKTINIDHHSSNPAYAQINLIDIQSPATCQVVYEYFVARHYSITSQMAINLLIGIYGDTGGFKYAKTTATTFQIASRLASLYSDFSKIIFTIENSNTPGNLIYKGISLKNIKTYFNGNLALSVVRYQDLIKYKITPQDTEKSEISNYIKSVIGWNIAISLVEVEPGVCNLSFRTRDPKIFDVGKLASLLGGGGHPVASGTKIKKPVAQAVKLLLKTTKKVYPDIDQ